MSIKFSGALNYDDVFIVPQYSEIASRKEVDTSVMIGKHKIEVPIMPANMLDIVDAKAALEFNKAGALACLHRFSSIEETVEDFLINKSNSSIFVSIGVNRDSKERFQALYNAGARNFIIDIAHGHSLQMKEMIQWIKSNYKETYIVAGNVATGDAVLNLVQWGADSIKIGVGPGSACSTKNVTGVTFPQFSAIRECVDARNKIDEKLRSWENPNKYTVLVADGGITEIGDLCKAIGAGADIVMTGKLFAGKIGTPSFQTNKYSGSASERVQTTYRTDKEYVPTPEGKTTSVILGGTIEQTVKDIAGGLKSAMSYSDARNIKEFHKQCIFGVRHNKT